MRKIRTILVDDEPLALRTLRLLLGKESDVEVVSECRNGAEAVKQITGLSPDLVFLDVQMPGMSGFDVIRTIGVDRMPVVVFVTAYDTYALKAFEAQALDYLLKPFEDSRFERTLRRAKTAIRRLDPGNVTQRLSSVVNPSENSGALPKPASRLMVSTNGKVVFLRADEIDWIGAVDYYVRIYVQKKSYLHRETMDHLERTLDPGKFFRIHRSTIVNIERVRELRSSVNGTYAVILHDGTSLTLSRRRRHQLRRML